MVSCSGEIAVVHNGVIENYLELRGKLEASGHRFSSETDSEVIPHLLEESVRLGKSFSQAFSQLPEKLRGSFAIVALAKGDPHLYLTRRVSPLVVGVSETGYHPASDIPSILNFTSKVVYLRENDCLEVGSRGIHRLSPIGGNPSPLEPTEVQSVSDPPDGMDKGDFDHFMIKEIFEQARIVESIVDAPPAGIDALVSALQGAQKVFIVGIGTSYHAALYWDRMASRLGLHSVRSVIASEMDQFESLIDKDSMVVVLSQSGETADTISAAKVALNKGAHLWGILNVPASTLGRLCHGVVPLNCGPEIAVAATKSYTAQVAVIIETLHRMVYKGGEGERLLKDAVGTMYDLTSTSVREHVQGLAKRLKDSPDIFLLGRGLQNVTAREAALKLKEVAGIRAEAFYMGEMKHGPFALVREGTPAMLFYNTKEKAVAEVASMELASRGAFICSVGPEPLTSSKWHIRTNESGTGFPLTQIVPLQILSYDIAALKQMDPDHPRNLAKSVTVG
jgi:glucosamine--fructose-6-phosphate aminotransferase (isomerizing)